MKKSLIGILIALTMAPLLLGGCKGDPPRVAQKGEACQTTSDCAGSLSCVPLTGTASGGGGGGGVCVTGVFKIAATTKECVLGCTEDAECGSGTCAGGKCVQCTDDSGCPTHETCQSGQCVLASTAKTCVADSECPYFNRCSAGTCVESGCQTDRECVAATDNVEATCGKDGKCIVACQTDIECGNPKSYSFSSCINNQCTYVGCANDKECELRMGPSSGAGYGHPVCREKK